MGTTLPLVLAVNYVSFDELPPVLPALFFVKKFILLFYLPGPTNANPPTCPPPPPPPPLTTIDPVVVFNFFG